MDIKFYHDNNNTKRKNCIVLSDDTWDDWGRYKTMFSVTYYDILGNHVPLGRIKLGVKKMERGRPKIPRVFTELTDEFFSLGEGAFYYTELNKLEKDIRIKILVALNDIAYNTDKLEEIKNEDIFNISLMRNFSYYEIKYQLHRISTGGAELTDYKLKYTFPNAKEKENPTSFVIKVNPNSIVNTNIHAIIGRNGVGKTFLLKNMIKAILEEGQDKITGKFELFDLNEGKTLKDTFANLILVAFSIFDEFEKSKKIEYEDRFFDYFYIGSSIFSKFNNSIIESENDSFYESYVYCLERERKKELLDIAFKILSYDDFFDYSGILDYENLIDKKGTLKINKDKIISNFRRLSSGHKITLLSIVKIIENVEEKSLIILDEPETHLHPPLLSAYIRVISEVLIRRNAIALIATHSPIILQEIPSRNTWKLKRNQEEIQIENVDINTFGMSIDRLTQEVFGLEIEHTGFHSIIKELSKKYTKEELLLEFENANIGIGNDALSFIHLLYYLQLQKEERAND